MSPSDHRAGLLNSIDQFLSSDGIQTLFLVDTVLMLIGMITVAVLAWKHLPVSFWHKVLFEAALFFVGTGLSGTAYETYHIVQIVNEKSWDSQKIEDLFQKVNKTSQTVQGTSQKIEKLSLTVQELSRKLDDLNCPPEKTGCWQKTDRSNCASKASLTVPPAQAESKPSHSAASALEADGWVYVGTRSGPEWDEKYFDWDGEKARLPGEGDILTATGSVHLRMPLGCQAPIVGAIALGEQVQVLRTQTVADCHHWVQVKRM
ncbi:MAG: hypothetical protein OXF97_04575 [Nitrospira sp.]|nr:hypothetical protein [Nitrospira sp.]